MINQLRDEPKRELTKIKMNDIVIEDHGFVVLDGNFEYESGSCQGLSYGVSAEFLKKLMMAIGVTSFGDMYGKSCWVTHTMTDILKIEPLHKEDGRPFDILEWSNQKRKEKSDE